ncbi:MAG: DUF1329 domain-containing protein [bacterium]|nr:DUF1329 domain-containing protein [bacterium]
MAVAIEPGMVLREDDLMLLRQLIPQELWRHREIFFHEGMRIEVGPCHRRYAVAEFYRQATEKFAGQAHIDAEGNLVGYTAGLPFPPDRIDPKAPDAGGRWAFDVEQRYVGAGYRGAFRITDLPGRVGSPQVYEGDFYFLKVAHRADLAEQDYRIEDKHRLSSAAGGQFKRPFNARHLAWRQFRKERASRRHSEPDDIFAYIPTMRKVRRAAANWVDGLYVPRYSVTGDGGGGGIQYGGSGGSISPTASRSIAVSEDMRRGLVGITLRANAYHWRIVGERDVLAPLNASTLGYPLEDDRNFGTSGLSLATDRWDLRRAVVIEGVAKTKNLDVASLLMYVDYQTQQPLYWVTRTSRHRLLDIGAFAYRYSDDLPDVREWPGGTPASVFLPVAAVFFDSGTGAGGWRRESYQLEVTPLSKERRRAMTTSDSLGRGR